MTWTFLSCLAGFFPIHRLNELPVSTVLLPTKGTVFVHFSVSYLRIKNNLSNIH